MISEQRFPLTRRQPDEIIAFRTGSPVRVDDFLDEVIALARRLPNHKWSINLHVDRYRYLRAFCAAILAGQCTLMPANRQPATLKQLREVYPDSYTIGESDDESGFLNSARRFASAVPEVASMQLCAIAFTSGSTGAPRPNYKYWQTLVKGSSSNEDLLLGRGSQTVNLLATVPAQHMWGLETSVVLPLFAPVAASNQVPFFPQDIASALAAIPAPRVLVSSPVHLDALLRSGVKLQDVARIYTATAPLSKRLAKALENEFQTTVTDIFGCTETGIIAARQTSTEVLWNLARAFELSTKSNGTRIAAEHLPEDVLMPDIIELAGNHQFRWIGRPQDMINIAGKRGSLADLNQRLREIPGVSDGVIFLPPGRGDRLAAMVVAPQLQVSGIVEHLRQQVEPVFLPRPIYLVPALPRQETGKLALAAVHCLFEEIRRSRPRAKETTQQSDE
jgi:acyl-coenzyme A synthetase/AMP-(fatty) acid ligase